MGRCQFRTTSRQGKNNSKTIQARDSKGESQNKLKQDQLKQGKCQEHKHAMPSWEHVKSSCEQIFSSWEHIELSRDHIKLIWEHVNSSLKHIKSGQEQVE